MSEHSSHRQKVGREGALLVQFGLDVTGDPADEALERTRTLIADIDAEVDKNWDLVEWRVRGVHDQPERIDEAVQEVSPRWRIERMGIIDRNLLRIGAWELLESDIEPIFTINACVELGKEYGEESTPDFVNGLLDELCSREGIEVA